jgi:Beta/Gamma crystallin
MPDVTIFEHSNFAGLSQILPKGRYNDALQEITIGNDKLSSLLVPAGLVARLYDHYHFQGRFIDIRQDTPNISLFWNDKISSIIVYGDNEPPPTTKEVMIFEHSDYAGKAQTLQIGSFDAGDLALVNDTLSSALIPYGMVLRLYEHSNFQGAFIEIREDTPAVQKDWQDRTSSIVVYNQPIGLWEISNGNIGVLGESTEFNGVRGISHSPVHAGTFGLNDNIGPGVFGRSAGVGVWGESKTWMGVFGRSESTSGGAGVMGEAQGSGVIGVSKTWIGVYGHTESTDAGAGVWGEHKGRGNGMVAISKSGVGIYAEGSSLAGKFKGDIEVTGDIRLTNADCAEDFDICEMENVEPGTVMVLNDDGKLRPSHHAYDKRVAGVVSGAGSYKPGIVLDKQPSEGKRQPIALLGKVYCKVDTQYAAIEVGDLLTTSPTAGHAMKAQDPLNAFGAVIGKALRPFQAGRGLIPILIALQ